MGKIVRIPRCDWCGETGAWKCKVCFKWTCRDCFCGYLEDGGCAHIEYEEPEDLGWTVYEFPDQR